MKIFSLKFWKRILGLSKPKKVVEKPVKPKVKTEEKPQPRGVEVEHETTTKPKPIMPNSEKPKLYALIVGINDYQYVTKLGGCVNDATRIHDYLADVTKEGSFEYAPVLLTNEKATKDKIVHYFENHLAKATANDVAFFYFSGHGAQEQGDDVWKISEADGLLETMVCYDSRDEKGTPDLADKELRYLISKVARNNPHIVVVADSCHSGDNTRPSELVKRRLPDAEQLSGILDEEVKSRLSAYAPMRTWDKFCFSKEIPKEQIAAANALQEVIPEGKHIQIAACKDKELAYELKGSGIFTSLFLEVLKRSAGTISYLDLHSRLKNIVKGKYPQTPQIYISNRDATELKAAFLGGASTNKPTYYNVQKNTKSSIGWTIDIGAIHGMPPKDDANPLAINILDPKDESNVLVTASVREVLPGYSTILIEGDLDGDQTYFATIDGLFTVPMKIFVEGNSNGVDLVKKHFQQKADDLKRANLDLTDDLALADFLVYAKGQGNDGSYYIGRPLNDFSKIDQTYVLNFKTGKQAVPYWKWITEHLSGFTEGNVNELMRRLQHIARWEFIKRLENPRTTIYPNPPVKVKFFEAIIRNGQMVDKKILSINADGVLELDYISENDPYQDTFITIEVENTSNRTYHVAMPALFMGFDIYTDLLRGGAVEIDAGNTEKAHQGMPLQLRQQDPIKGPDGNPYDWNDWIKDFNWAYKSVFFKLIVSTSEFEISGFAQEDLPYPRIHRGEASRGFANTMATVSHATKDDWTAVTYELRLRNPFYVKPPEDLIG